MRAGTIPHRRGVWLCLSAGNAWVMPWSQCFVSVTTVFIRLSALLGPEQLAGGQYIGKSIRVVVMLDFLMIAYGVGFFVVAVLYALACEKM